MATKRIQKFVSFDSGMQYTFPSGNIAYVSSLDADYGTTARFSITFHQGEYMPSYKSESFDTIELLAARMKELSGDLRKWQKSVREEA